MLLVDYLRQILNVKLSYISSLPIIILSQLLVQQLILIANQ